jgi:hypothetical protein
MSERYLVLFEVDEGEWMYSSAENPFTYDSKPIIFETKGEAEAHRLRYNNAHVVKQSDIKPFTQSERERAKVRSLINKGI